MLHDEMFRETWLAKAAANRIIIFNTEHIRVKDIGFICDCGHCDPGDLSKAVLQNHLAEQNIDAIIGRDYTVKFAQIKPAPSAMTLDYLLLTTDEHPVLDLLNAVETSETFVTDTFIGKELLEPQDVQVTPPPATDTDQGAA